jgi:hypothetical protein
VRALLVKDFNLDADPPIVTTHAKYVKRRKTHTQVFRPALATDLRERFKSNLPAAAAIKMPSKYHMAEMLRRDLAAARAAWIQAAGQNEKEREARQRSDFLADLNNKGEKAVFAPRPRDGPGRRRRAREGNRRLDAPREPHDDGALPPRRPAVRGPRYCRAAGPSLSSEGGCDGHERPRTRPEIRRCLRSPAHFDAVRCSKCFRRDRRRRSENP